MSTSIIRRRTRLIAAALVFLAPTLHLMPARAQHVWPGQAWTISTPEAQGLRSAPLVKLDANIRIGIHGNIDRMVVVRNGYIVVDHVYNLDYDSISRGQRTAIGCGIDMCSPEEAADPFNYLHPSTHPYYKGRDVHSLQSVTKSVAATVVGIALTRGAIDSLGTPILQFFEGYDTRDVDPRLHEATLEDLLTMRTGIEWHEQNRPLNETNTTIQLERSPDWVQFTLDQPMDAAPGEKWVYNSGGSHLMSQIVRSATGMLLNEYAEAHLFGPLQIPDYHWKVTPQGLPDTEGGLYLEAAQLAKIGYLYLQRGMWNEHRILSEDFVRRATHKHVENVNAAGWGYGYQWWRLDRDDTIVWAGLGFGGQYLFVLPQHNIVGVINSWNVFGQRFAPVSPAFLTALITATQ